MEQNDWDDLEHQMSQPYGRMSLQCDQFQVSLVQVTDSRSRKWSTQVYVDGVQKGAWWFADDNGEPKHEEARRFLRRVSKSLFSEAEVALHRKAFGKRSADKLAEKRFVSFECSWTSFRSLKKHLLANNPTILRIEREREF